MPSLQNPILPDDVFFSRLLEVASRQGDRIIVDDRSRSTQFGYRDILHGTVTLKKQLQRLLDPTILDRRGEFFIGLLAPNGYEFIIGVLATWALGGIVVPMPIGALPGEAAYILRQCPAHMLLVGPEQRELAREIRAETPILSREIPPPTCDLTSLPSVTAYARDKSLAVPDDTPSILFFTSGTTGPPKGVLHARRTINKYARRTSPIGSSPSPGHDDDEDDDELCLIPRGAFWSIYFTTLFQMLVRGVRVEIQDFGRQYDVIWERLRQRTATRMVLSPTFWYGLMVHYTAHIAPMEEAHRREYVDGLRYLRDACMTGAMPSTRLKEFWRELRGGRALKVLYGTTETQEIAMVGEDEYSPETDLGTPLHHVTVKLSHGEEGEVLVKTPSMFLGYLHASEDSEQRFDSEGFFKTGDLAVRRHGRIIFKGRANLDLFKFYTYKVPRLHVEARLTALSYVTEGYIMPVEDPQCDTRVAALVRIDDETNRQIDLERIRSDLAVDLPAYQLPTVLRLLQVHESIPRTWSDKTAMQKAIHLFFPQDTEHQLVGSNTEVMDIRHFMKAETQHMWDLSGMR